MNSFFQPNIDKRGRWARALAGCSLAILGIVLAIYGQALAGVAVLLFGLFAWYEAAQGWCLLRACGIRTKL